MAATNRSGGNRWYGDDKSKPDGGPQKPPGQSDQFNEKWDELLTQLPVVALRRIDAHQLAILVRLLCDELTIAKALEADPLAIPLRRQYLQVVAAIGRLSAQFGLSLADRKRLAIDPNPPDEDDADEWSDDAA